MRVRALSALLSIAFPLAATASATAIAALRNADGKKIGTATFTQTPGGVKVHVVAAGLSPGQHGIHIHSVGRCDPPDFKSAGGHLNPSAKQHGLRNPEGAHAGDMPNLVVGKNGKVTTTLTAKGATLGEGKGSLFGPEGTSLVIHADADDEKTDPAGNAGARVACGVIERE